MYLYTMSCHCYYYLPLGFFSKMYFSIFEPPLSFGSFHAKVIAVGFTSVASKGPCGSEGLSEKFE